MSRAIARLAVRTVPSVSTILVASCLKHRRTMLTVDVAGELVAFCLDGPSQDDVSGYVAMLLSGLLHTRRDCDNVTVMECL